MVPPPYYNKNRLCSKTCGKEMNTEREQIKKELKNWKIKRKGDKREKKDLNYILLQILSHKEWPDEFFL